MLPCINDHVISMSARGISARDLGSPAGVHLSDFNAWCNQPESKRANGDKRLLGHIKQSCLESGAVYGYRKVSEDLRDLGERYGFNCGDRIMHGAGLR